MMLTLYLESVVLCMSVEVSDYLRGSSNMMFSHTNGGQYVRVEKSSWK